MLLRHYVWLMGRWLWLLVLGTVVCAGVTYQVVKHMTPSYQADALVLVNGAPATSADYNNVLSSQALAQSYSLLMTDPAALADVAKKVPGVTVNDLETMISVFPNTDTQLIDVRASAPDGREAATIANTVAAVFIQGEQAKEAALLANIIAPVQTQLTQAQASMNSADAQLSALEHTFLASQYLPAQQQEISNEITHQQEAFDVARSNYETLLQSYETLQTAQRQIPYTLGIAQAAVPPTKPKSPQVSLSVAIAAAMGLLLMVVLVLLLDRLNTTIKTPEDVANLAGLEPLGSVPNRPYPYILATVPHRPRFGWLASVLGQPSRPDVPVAPDKRIEQAFMAIVTNFSVLRKDKRLILVTSLRRRAGVSTTAANLAVALAQSSVRVLLIDANFHSPELHYLFHDVRTGGLADTLMEIRHSRLRGTTPSFLARPSEAMESWLETWRTDEPGLWFMPAGVQPPSQGTDPLPSVGMPEMRTLIKAIATNLCAQPGKPGPAKLDVVILDVPALNQGADAIALTAVADAAILVTRAATERPEAFQKARTTFDRLGCPVFGVIVNRQRARYRPYFFVDAYRETSEPAHIFQPMAPVASQWLLVQPSTKAPFGASVPVAYPVGDTLDGMLDVNGDRRHAVTDQLDQGIQS